MKTRINIEDRAAIFREYLEKVEKLIIDFADLIDTEFAPNDARNYECVYDPYAEAREYDDKDTPLMRRVLKVLECLGETLSVRTREAESELDMYYEGMAMFRAWELGLCPYVMREYRREIPKYAGGAWDSHYWAEIAEYLDGRGGKRSQMFRAVEAWQEAKALMPAM